MKYHNTHGTAITLSGNRSIATRKDGIFCNGICFGDQQVKINQRTCLEVTLSSTWSGALGIGVTSNNPSKINQADLPRFAYHNLTEKDGYWINSVPEKLLQNGSKLTISLSSSGSLLLFVDGSYKGTLLSNLPSDRQFWFVIDIYGNTTSAKFVKPDDAPKEIFARGPEAILAYEEACSTGTKVVYRTRLMLVGQDRVGKTSLKKSLTGHEHDENEIATDGIDLSFSCSFNMSQRSTWQAEIQRNKIEEENNQTQDAKQEPVDALGEEYYKALAENIVKEMAKSKMNKAKKDSMKILSLGKKTMDKEKLNPKGINQPGNNSQNSSGNKIKDIPERVMELVQELLDQQEDKNPMRKKSKVTKESKEIQDSDGGQKEPEKTVVLNIWDFAGQSAYYTMHEVFLTFRAVYVIVFNLCHDLHGNRNSPEDDSKMTTIGYIDYWLKIIHAHTSINTKTDVNSDRLSPPVFIVGTHRNSLSSDPQSLDKMVEERFAAIRDFVKDKPYSQHIVTPFIAVENNLDTGAIDLQIDILRQKIEEISLEESYMGETIPLKWLKFEHEVSKLVDRGTKYASYDQIQELAKNHGICLAKEFQTMLMFYHDLGVLLYYGGSGSLDSLLLNTIILKPQWLVDMFRKIVTAKPANDKWNLSKDRWRTLNEKGRLEETLIDSLWKGSLEEKPLLLGLMDKFDLICECLFEDSEVGCGGRSKPRTFYIPSRLTVDTSEDSQLYKPHPNHGVFFFNFKDNLPEGLYHRLVTRTIRWSQQSSGKDPHGMTRDSVRFYLDHEHDFVLELAPRHCHRIKVVLIRVTDLHISEVEEEEKEEEEEEVFVPKPALCAKLRNLLETTLYDLKEMWMKRLQYSTCVQCPCDKVCSLHGNVKCQDVDCVHLLNLDECLTSNVVCCDHRRVKTLSIQKFYPEPVDLGCDGNILPHINIEKGNIEKYSPQIPLWIKGAAKLLDSGTEDQDWMALARLMGYKDQQIDVLMDNTNPSLAFLADWILAGGNTTLAVDMLVGYLEKLGRDDVIDVISSGRGDTKIDPPKVFISYQWDIQDDVGLLRDKLEKSGFTCWMDIGQMGGGDQLSAKIDAGVRSCKVFLACLTPKYVISHHCNRELSLADLLKKPIIPIMFEAVEWPPPGGMSLILSQLVYIQMKGAGGHGGYGIHADLNDKYREVINKILMFASPNLAKYFDNETLLSISSKSSVIEEDIRSFHSQDTHDRLLQDIADRFSARNLNLTRAYLPPLPARTDQHETDRQSVLSSNQPQQVHVAKCSVCTIL